MAVFTGDCLFLGGVGRFFEGTPEQMTYILKRCVELISPEAKLFYGHNYGVKNIKWALKVAQDN